mgnify:FL=1|tara:strand:+ start:389 stop:613 length:225 start_codon:yes stop_codon:yes gene_type:complete
MGTRLNNSILFSENIEKLVQSTKMTYLDAVLHYCEENKLEPESASKMINGKLLQNIQEEAENLHLITSSAKLPI